MEIYFLCRKNLFYSLEDNVVLAQIFVHKQYSRISLIYTTIF